MGKYTREEIIEKAKELAKMISETEEVVFFKKAEAKIQANQKVQEKIADIKRLQKQAVNLQNYGKVNALKQVEAKIEELEKEIDEIPVVQEFKDSQYEVNELLQLVSRTIAEKVTDEILESRGTDSSTGTMAGETFH